VVLEVTANKISDDAETKESKATDGNTNELFRAEKTWFEIGVDTDRDMRYGAWQIKEIIDLTLPPLQTQKEQYLINFDTDVEKVEVEAKLYYYISGGKGDVVYSVKKTLEFDVD
jgi:hypothetical protein